jgi:hypothetical protein
MDPLSALSIAASVVQFVDFGRHLLSDSYEIYKSPSGESAKEVDLKTISKDLTDLVTQIKDKAGTSSGVKRDQSTAEYQLAEISKDCEKILKEFKGALEKLGRQTPSKGTRFRLAGGAFLRALEKTWSSSSLNQMRERLEKMKARLVTATLFCLW